MVVAFLSSCILKTNVCVKKKTKKKTVSILPLITITQMTKNQKEKEKNIEIVNVIETV